MERMLGEGGKKVLPVRIEGEWYDHSDYRDAHPGGKWLLDYSYGKDVTAIFKSIHLFSDAETSPTLKKLPIIDIEAEMLRNPHVFSADLVPATVGQEVCAPTQNFPKSLCRCFRGHRCASGEHRPQQNTRRQVHAGKCNNTRTHARMHI